MKKSIALLLFVFLPFVTGAADIPAGNFADIDLDGEWRCGIDRKYESVVKVPGIHLDASKITEGRLWYSREVRLPGGEWTDAVLELDGARFRPEVYVNGRLVSSREGGMCRTEHRLDGVRPGETITLEISLAGLKDVPLEDASYIPAVDQWRSNVSSCLWDDVSLHLYRKSRVCRALVWCNSTAHSADIRYTVEGNGASSAVIVISEGGKELFRREGKAAEGENEIHLDYAGILREWTPENPVCYDLEISLAGDDGRVLSRYGQTLNLREFSVKDKNFLLNSKRIVLRGGSVVWHRWVRDEEAREVAYDTEWFVRNIVRNIKDRGGNYIRFHLGVPPRRILDICDKYGLVVQYEWSFFHGMPASLPSLMEQYTAWLDVASRHPSVMLMHPYNETEKDELVRVWTALDSLCAKYPPMVLADRDVYHIHRYWWGMSENLGLYFNSADQFNKAIMVDEFGGIYLDGKYEPGGYPMLLPALKRWLGPGHTVEDRIRQQNLSYGKVGEYWRRIGAAGVAAFPILCSWQDGNNWFCGPVKEGRLKPVWEKMTSVWAEKTITLDVWDRNYRPGQKVTVPLVLINDSAEDSRMDASVCISGAGFRSRDVNVSRRVPANSKMTVGVSLTLPSVCGEYTLSARLSNPSPEIKYPVVSSWDINVLEAVVPSRVASSKVFIPSGEAELLKMAGNFKLRTVGKPMDADIILVGASTLRNLNDWRATFDEAVRRGISIVMLEFGDRGLGAAYIDEQKNLEALSGATRIEKAETVNREIIAGLHVSNTQLAEGESHIHPADSAAVLWYGLGKENTRLWNGLRGGLIVPASGLEFIGLSRDAYIAQWSARGADTLSIKQGPYYAYEYCGFYTYDNCAGSARAEKFLKDKVEFLVQDMPSLALSLPRGVPMRTTDLHGEYVAAGKVRVSGLEPLVVAGKNLVRTPVALISFGPGEGKLVVSQLLTEGRLADGLAEQHKYYPVGYDGAAVQMVLNMMAVALGTDEVGFSHVANSAAATDTGNAGSSLLGAWKYSGCASSAENLAAAGEKTLSSCGFGKGEAELVFGGGSSFEFRDGRKVIPGTWKEEGEKITLRFSKIFTYSMEGRIVSPGDGSLRLLFPSEKFGGFLQRTLAIVGGKDTAGVTASFGKKGAEDSETGFNISR